MAPYPLFILYTITGTLIAGKLGGLSEKSDVNVTSNFHQFKRKKISIVQSIFVYLKILFKISIVHHL